MDRFEKVVEDLGRAFQDFKARNDDRLSNVEKSIDAIDRHLGKTGKTGGGSTRNDSAAREHGKAFYNWMRSGADSDIRGLEVKAELSTLSDPDGGYALPQKLDNNIESVVTDSVAMRQIAEVKKGLSGDFKRPFAKASAESGWVGEKETRSETDTPELALFQPSWSEVYSLPEVTQRLLDNVDFDLESWLVQALIDAETSLEGQAFISGDGVGKPRGILSYDTVANASWAWGSIGYIAGGNADTFTSADKLIELQHALKPQYRKNAVWLMNDATLETVRKLKTGDGNYLWGSGLLAGQPDTLLGKPVFVDDFMDDIGADAFPIAFGDFKRGYLIGDHRAGRRLIRDPYSAKGKVGFYMSKQVFGGCYNFEAYKLLKISES